MMADCHQEGSLENNGRHSWTGGMTSVSYSEDVVSASSDQKPLQIRYNFKTMLEDLKGQIF
jgi:hypothetical protein